MSSSSSSRVEVLNKPKTEKKNTYLDIYKTKQVDKPALPAPPARMPKGTLEAPAQTKTGLHTTRGNWGRDGQRDRQGTLADSDKFSTMLDAAWCLLPVPLSASFFHICGASVAARCKCGLTGRCEFFPLQSLLTIFARLDNKTQSEVSSLKLLALLRFACFI